MKDFSHGGDIDLVINVWRFAEMCGERKVERSAKESRIGFENWHVRSFPPSCLKWFNRAKLLR